jgi:hypothetical protein
MCDTLTALTEAEVSIWLDDLSRERLTTGGLAVLVDQWHVSGVTTNPSIFAKAIGHSDAYRPQVHDLARRPPQPRPHYMHWPPRCDQRGRTVHRVPPNQLALAGIPGSGSPAEVMDDGITAPHIVAAASWLLGAP